MFCYLVRCATLWYWNKAHTHCHHRRHRAPQVNYASTNAQSIPKRSDLFRSAAVQSWNQNHSLDSLQRIAVLEWSSVELRRSASSGKKILVRVSKRAVLTFQRYMRRRSWILACGRKGSFLMHYVQKWRKYGKRWAPPRLLNVSVPLLQLVLTSSSNLGNYTRWLTDADSLQTLWRHRSRSFGRILAHQRRHIVYSQFLHWDVRTLPQRLLLFSRHQTLGFRYCW